MPIACTITLTELVIMASHQPHDHLFFFMLHLVFFHGIFFLYLPTKSIAAGRLEFSRATHARLITHTHTLFSTEPPCCLTKSTTTASANIRDSPIKARGQRTGLVF